MLPQSHELFWYFNEAESALGYSSNYSTFEYCMTRGTAQGENFYVDPEAAFDDHRINSASKYKRIESKFSKLNKRQQYVLQLYGTYAKRHWKADPKIYLVFDDITNVLFLDYEPEQLSKIVNNKQQKKADELKQQYRKEVKQCLLTYQKLLTLTEVSELLGYRAKAPKRNNARSLRLLKSFYKRTGKKAHEKIGGRWFCHTSVIKNLLDGGDSSSCVSEELEQMRATIQDLKIRIEYLEGRL